MGEKKWFWATLALSSITVVSVVFAAWELVQNHFFRGVDYVTLHFLYVTRGVASSLILAFWAAWFVLQQRRKSEDDLRRSRERYRGLLEDFPGAVILYDRDLHVLEWNAAAVRMYGYSKAEVVGQVLPIVPGGKMGELREFMRRVEAADPILDVETTRLLRTGEPFAVQLSLRPFRDPGEPVSFLEATLDIRERVRWREAMLEIEKLASMGKMAAGTAHHLNTPLAALLLRVEMMRDNAGGNGLAEDLTRLEDGLKFCRHFVQRLLEFARKEPVQKQNLDLGLTLESVAGFFMPALRAKGAVVRVETEGTLGGAVWADRNQIETVLLILLSNALDAIPVGGEVRLGCRRAAPDAMEVTVADNGCGIRQADLDRAFEPFFTTKEPGKGTGLGLSIARQVVLEHGGTIALESAPGRGTVARITLPLVKEAVA